MHPVRYKRRPSEIRVPPEDLIIDTAALCRQFVNLLQFGSIASIRHCFWLLHNLDSNFYPRSNFGIRLSKSILHVLLIFGWASLIDLLSVTS